MKTANQKSLPPIIIPLFVAAVHLDLFTRMIFMGRRKKVRYLTRTIFQQTTHRRW
jgi:hypothetical protein